METNLCEVGKVRIDPRPCSQPDSFGDDMKALEVASFRSELVDMLLAQGYRERVYCMTSDMVTIAYITDEVPFREEPILLDYGGTIIDVPLDKVKEIRSKQPHNINDIEPIAGNYVLKIAIRDANGDNEELHDKVVRLLAKHGVVNPHADTSPPVRPGTVVYALKEFNEFLD